MSTHVIVGSGAMGGPIASLLADRGESVRMVTRSGTGPEHDLIERVAGDAADVRRLTELTAGADVLYNCTNPKYTEWAQKWFPRWVNHAAGRVNPMLREVAEMDYQFYFPFHLDSTLTEQTFGLTPTPIEVALRETAADAERVAARTM